MATSEIPGTGSAVFSDLGLTKTPVEEAAKKSLGQAEFFDLMVAQLKFQDPLKPMANTEFVSQVAQFSSVNSLGAIEGSLAQLVGSFQSNQALQASTLVGREVLVPGGVGRLESGGSVAGALELPQSAAAVSVQVLDAAGALVRRIELGPQAGGRVHFQWDGLDAAGNPAPAGPYLIQGDAQLSAGPIALETLVRSRVESVTLRQSPPGATLNLSGLGAVDMSAVRELL